ncbi:MAG: hypothetical protein IT280_05745 [Ignavibacteria bacterium]|nr:hypothetical protein [Ignavibacteria bacterium]
MKSKKLIYRLFPLIALTALYYFSSCWYLDSTDTLFRIQVDSISVPAYINNNSDSLPVKFWGKIGEDSCYSFSHYQASQDSAGLIIAAWGLIHTVYRQICADGDIQLNGREYKIWPLRNGVYTVSVLQPDGTILRKYIQVN